MTKEELATKLNGRQYLHEMTREECAQAKKDGLLVMFGASDNLVELCGAIGDELSACNGTTVLLSANGKLVVPVDREDEDVLDKYLLLEVAKEREAKAHKVRALWCAEAGLSWTFETALPHATFDIMEDEEVFCRGIVIDMKDVVKTEAAK